VRLARPAALPSIVRREITPGPLSLGPASLIAATQGEANNGSPGATMVKGDAPPEARIRKFPLLRSMSITSTSHSSVYCQALISRSAGMPPPALEPTVMSMEARSCPAACVSSSAFRMPSSIMLAQDSRAVSVTTQPSSEDPSIFESMVPSKSASVPSSSRLLAQTPGTSSSAGVSNPSASNTPSALRSPAAGFPLAVIVAAPVPAGPMSTEI